MNVKDFESKDEVEKTLGTFLSFAKNSKFNFFGCEEGLMVRDLNFNFVKDIKLSTFYGIRSIQCINDNILYIANDNHVSVLDIGDMDYTPLETSLSMKKFIQALVLLGKPSYIAICCTDGLFFAEILKNHHFLPKLTKEIYCRGISISNIIEIN